MSVISDDDNTCEVVHQSACQLAVSPSIPVFKCFCNVTSEGEYGRRVWIRTLCRKLCLHNQALQRKVTVLRMQTPSAVYEPEEVLLHSRGVKETPE